MVGCFDKDIEGFLLIMNDGDFNYELMSLNKYVFKKYEVILVNFIIEDDI